MSPSATQQMPVVPPRPSRSADKDAAAGAMPRIPPRPVNKRLERSLSPSHDRFAPSPFNEGIVSRSSNSRHLSPGYGATEQPSDPIERTGSVPMPSVGEEGMEYNAMFEDSKNEDVALTRSRSNSPEQTRTVGADVKLHAPKPSLPAHSAKQRVAAVTRTDSDKAASFGIGRSSMDEPRETIKKKPSTSFSTTSDTGHQTDDEHGIPEIGQRVPMNPNLGDVQAPSPAPSLDAGKKNHNRKHSARGLPPGSYGLHGHGVQPQDKLDKAWYQKHPDQMEREQHTPLHDRQNDFAMSSADLNKLVRTPKRTAGHGPSTDSRPCPTDEVAFQASEEYATRIASRPASAAANSMKSPLRDSFSAGDAGDDIIHVDDARHPEYRSYGNEGSGDEDDDREYHTPILASDEVAKDVRAYPQHPAIHAPERRGSAFDSDEGPSRPSSRPTSRPSSIYHHNSQTDWDSTPLEDVQEYEPLFDDEAKAEQIKRKEAERKARHHFPSKDIWEDAPNSVHYTAQVSTPELPTEHRRKSSSHLQDRPLTPAQAFALHQEELAEKEMRGGHQAHAPNKFLSLSEDKPKWIDHQSHLRSERPSSGHRFPSRDIWEDAPESQLHQITITPSDKESAAEEEQPKPEIPSRPAQKSTQASSKPAIPERPKPKSSPSDENVKVRPPVSDKPKPQVPARPTKSLSGDSKESEPGAKPKPPVPSRPVGGKIAALQAGFMNDLNKRLQLGPQAHKKDEASPEEPAEEKEKAPLSDARKSRARGPQRRAPAKAAAPVAAGSGSSTSSVPTLSFSLPQTSWTIDPDDGLIAVDAKAEDVIPITEQSEVTAEPESTVESTIAAAAAEEAEEKGAPVPEAPVEEKEAVPIADPATEEATLEKAESPEKIEAEEDKAEHAAAEPETVEKILVANTAGESVLETTLQKDDKTSEVEPVEVDDEVKA